MKRMILSALISGLAMWGLTELFAWIIADVIGTGIAAAGVARFSPLLAGGLLGALVSALRQAVQKKREEMLPNENQT